MSLGLVKKTVKQLFAKPPIWERLGPIVRRPGVVVLTYHDILGEEDALEGVSIEAFGRQMRWLRDHCDPIGPEALVERSRDPRLARPAVLVTFDDGYRSYHDLAYPVLKQLGIPALVFIATSFLDDGAMMWTDEVQWASLLSKATSVRLPWSGDTIALPSEAARMSLGEKARAHLKTLPDQERRVQMKALIEALGAPPRRSRAMLTWDEVRSTMDLTRYGGHSHTHPILSRLDTATANAEISTCHQRIAAETGKPPTFFAYPNGSPRDYTAETKQIVRAHGFDLAFTTTEGIAGPDSDWLAVKRISAGDLGTAEFAWTVAGLNRS